MAIEELFYLWENAKTPSFFPKQNGFFVTQEQKEELIKVSKENNETARICLHESPEDNLHVMLIYHPYKKRIENQLYLHTPSYYMLLEGRFSLERLDTLEKIVFDVNETFICRIDEGVLYNMEVLSDGLLFIEVRKKNCE